jgi:hypothetical protein
LPLEPLDPLDPLEPDEPDDPLEPEEPLLPLDPEEPLVPDEPLDPAVPLAPELPLLPDEPLLPAGSVGSVEVLGALKSSLELAPLHATSETTTAERIPVVTTIAAARGFMTAELYRPEQRCPTPSAHNGDSFPSLSGGLARS